jgi:6-phosphogluconolactonase
MRKTALLLAISILQLSAAQYLMYVGTYTGKGSDGIYAYQFDSTTGTAKPLGLMAKVDNPSFLTLSPNGRTLYAADETHDYKNEKSGYITVFARAADGKLTEGQRFSSHGADPCDLAVDPSGRVLAVANYTGGNFVSFPLGPDGLAAPEHFAEFSGTGVGPNHDRQDSPHGHSVNFSSDDRFLLATDLGTDEILVRQLDKETLDPGRSLSVKVHPGAGPRHLVFNRANNRVYVVNEIDSTVVGYEFKNGTLTEFQQVSTLPEDFKSLNTTAEIAIDPSGKFLYASNRGHDSIARFTIDQRSGRLTEAGWTPSGGKGPRNFTIDPSGHFLLAANQNSANIAIFRINAKTGDLKPAGVVSGIDSPVCLLFVKPTAAARSSGSAPLQSRRPASQ